MTPFSYRFLTLLPICIFLSCKSDPIQPTVDKSIRNLAWTRDTLGNGNFQSLWTAISGLSINELYLVGHSSDLFVGKIWQFNGLKWNDISSDCANAMGEARSFRQVFSFDITGIACVGNNDVWFSGWMDTSGISSQYKSGFVLHKSGATWHGYAIPSSPGLLDIWGTSSLDLWVTGSLGAVYHLENGTWQAKRLQDSLSAIHVEGSTSGQLFVGAWGPTPAGHLRKIYQRNDSGWVILDSKFETDPQVAFQPTFALYDNGLYSWVGNRVTKYVSPTIWQDFFVTPQSHELWMISAFGSVGFFASGTSGGEYLFHYNGTDWYRYPQFQNSNIGLGRVWTNGTEVFVQGFELTSQGTTWSRSFIYHGK